MISADQSEELAAKVTEARDSGNPLVIMGGNTRAWLGNAPEADFPTLSVAGHRGVIDYQPEELVIRVRAGTPLTEVVSLLAANQQYLPFEPPAFGSESTIGGVIATGLSGPGRPFRGAVRDHVLGATIISGAGECLSFGGQVMKNVAGYDVSRLMAGSYGVLGVLLDVSLKVLPVPQATVTLAVPLSVQAAHARMPGLSMIPEVSALAWYNGQLLVRYSGTEQAMARIRSTADGELAEDHIWAQIRDLSLPEIAAADVLWRISIKPSASDLLGETCLLDWCGGLRWIVPAEAMTDVRAGLSQGEAMIFRGSTETKQRFGTFHPMAPVPARLNLALKKRFDPAGILNPGRLFEEA
ncbi:MAG: glycolate oxidase subunit GlcE [Pseudomonadales bacterium]|nr:glycolate oxidase subunit GlcE [Pseudomonadales bacterium]